MMSQLLRLCRYCSLVRPRVEYVSQVWNPFTKSNISCIESIQRRATNFILKSDDEYLVSLRELCLLSLEDRRFIADVVFFNYKVVNNHVRLTLDCLNEGPLLACMQITCFW